LEGAELVRTRPEGVPKVYNWDIEAVDGREYSKDVLSEAIAQPQDGKISCVVRNFDSVETHEIQYAGGLRYPHLERIPGTKDYLSEILAPTRRVTVDEPLARPAQPGGVVSRRPRRSWVRRLVWLLLVAVIIGTAVWYFPRSQTQPKEGGRSQSGAPVPVGVSSVEKGDMPVTLSQLGTVTPLAMVTVKTQISGYLVQVAFKEGQMVNKGDFLAQIDPRPYQVALEQAQAQLAKDQALLRNAQLDLQRYNTLVAQNSIAKQTRDTQISLVAQDEATVKADQAQIDAQKLNLTYCRIVSPVTGRVGLWFAFAAVFIGYALIDDLGRFRWFVLIPICLSAMQLVGGVLLGRPSADR